MYKSRKLKTFEMETPTKTVPAAPKSRGNLPDDEQVWTFMGYCLNPLPEDAEELTRLESRYVIYKIVQKSASSTNLITYVQLPQPIMGSEIREKLPRFSLYRQKSTNASAIKYVKGIDKNKVLFPLTEMGTPFASKWIQQPPEDLVY